MSTCAFVTFGCKINFYDTQALRETILDLGYAEVPPAQPADLYVVNSCTVTGRAGEKSSAAVRRLARKRPDSRIIVTGCMTDEERRELSEVDGVFHVVGNEEKDQIPALLQGVPRQVVKGRGGRQIFRLNAQRFEGRTRAFLKVHDGCDEFCSYCIIPHMRGRSKSRPYQDVIAEAERFAEAGHQELVLTGIHLSRYGRDLDPPTRLIDLLGALVEIPGIERVRLSSIGEGAFSPEMIALFRDDPRLCRFFHIPLQSGSNTVLERMRRDYDVSVYLATIDKIREELPGSVIATDLMIGFPGETEAEFEESLETCRRARFHKMHLFPYSLRPKTRAAQLPGHLGPDVKEERMQRARVVEAELAQQSRGEWVGRSVRVLVEKVSDEYASGLSREGLLVRFRTDGPVNRNQEYRVLLSSQRDGELWGTIAATALQPSFDEVGAAVAPKGECS